MKSQNDAVLRVNSWDEWFELMGKALPVIKRYEELLHKYYKRRNELEQFGRPHKRAFWKGESVIAQSHVNGLIWFGAIGLFIGLIGSLWYVAAVLHEMVVPYVVGGTAAGLVLGLAIYLVPTIIRRALLVSAMAKTEEILAPMLSFVPQQLRNSWGIENLHDAPDYGYVDYDGAAGAVEAARQKTERPTARMLFRAMVDVPFDASGVKQVGRRVGVHSKDDPALPADIEAHTGAGSTAWRDDLDKLIGLAQVKAEVKRLENRVLVHGGSGAAVIGGNNMVLEGPAGVGKTTVARILTGMLFDAGIIQENRIVEIDGGYLKDGRVGMTDKRTNAVCTWALGGVLFIDEAYLLFDEGSTAGREATGVLLKFMEDHTQDLVVMLAGYTDDMERLINSNEGFRSRVRHKLTFPSYTASELEQIMEQVFLGGRGITLEQGCAPIIEHVFSGVAGTPGFGGAREARNAADDLLDLQADRIAHSGGDPKVVTVADARAWERKRTGEAEDVRHNYVSTAGIDEKIVSTQELEQRTRTIERTSEQLLHRLVGQAAAREELDGWKARALMTGASTGNANVALLGPAGVGKTTFAEVVTATLYEAGRIREPRMLDVTGDWFRANYVGQTGTRTEAAIQFSRGGVLFIDEAYLMADSAGSDFGSQAMGTLVNDMDKLDDLVVVVAGYDEEMRAFFAQNPGMASRVMTHIHMHPYTVRELMLILQRMAKAQGFKVAPDVYRTLQPGVERSMGARDFGQARAMRNCVEAMVAAHALRWSKDPEHVEKMLLNHVDAVEALSKLGW